EQDNLYKQVTNYPSGFFTGYSTPVKTFICPSDGRGLTGIAPGNGAVTHYLGVTGQDRNLNNQLFGPTDGIFNITATGLSLTDISDASSNTLAVGERPPAKDLGWGWWAASDYDCLLSAYQLYGLYSGHVYPGLFRAPTTRPVDENAETNHFWSRHTGGG